MKLTKEEWKQFSDRIFLTLRPTQHPVAMKFIKTPEEFDAIPGIEFCQNKASTCKLIGMAAHFQGTFGLTPDHFSGYYCAMNNGCMEVNQEFLDGAILYKQPTPWTTKQEDAIKHIKSNLEVLPETPLRRYRLLLSVQLPHRRARRHLPPASHSGRVPSVGLLC